MQYLVYENWRASKTAKVHIGDCGYTNEGHNRLNDYTAPNDRWFGYFASADAAIAFAALLPGRRMELCRCMERNTSEQNNE